MQITPTTALAAVLLAAASPVLAQESDLEDRLQSLALANAELYIRPVAEALGHALTAGFAETARSHRVLGFNIGLRVMGAVAA
jgi:hypothetical protein